MCLLLVLIVYPLSTLSTPSHIMPRPSFHQGPPGQDYQSRLNLKKTPEIIAARTAAKYEKSNKRRRECVGVVVSSRRVYADQTP